MARPPTVSTETAPACLCAFCSASEPPNSVACRERLSGEEDQAHVTLSMRRKNKSWRDSCSRGDILDAPETLFDLTGEDVMFGIPFVPLFS